MFVQGSIFADGVPALATDASWRRIELGRGAWLDVADRWLTGADRLFDELVAGAPWRQGSRRMYDDVVDDPRLSWRPQPAEAPPVVEEMRTELQHRYGVPLAPAFFNFYRDGRDSVAWHRDRVLRDAKEAIVAVVSLGSARRFRVRPLGGGTSVGLRPGSGDLVVMGGTAQVHFEHCVPKSAAGGPRISVSMRWHAT